MKNSKFDDLILKFLSVNYPIDRIKIDGRFRRGVIIEGTGYAISQVQQFIRLEQQLLKILRLIFNYEEKYLKPIIRHFFNKT